MLKRKSPFTLLVLVFIVTFAAAGCGQPAAEAPDDGTGQQQAGTVYPITVEDDRGVEVTIASEPQRIITIAPSNTEILFAIGVGDRIVGVDNFSNYPDEALSKERVGDVFNMNYEKVVALNPDLIVSVHSQDVVPELEKLGVPVYVKDPQNIDQVIDTVRLYGELLSVEEQAEELASSMEAEIAALMEAVAGIPEPERVSVYYEVWWQEPSLMTAGSGTFIDDLITRANAENIASDLSGWTSISLETIVERDPAVILTTFQETIDGFNQGQKQAWKDISAVKNGRVYLLNQDIVARPGPRLVEALRSIVERLYPDALK